MRGLALDPLTHDLSVSAGRFLTVDEDAATVQQIRTRLLFFRGESFTDQREGVPYWEEILAVKGVDLGRVKTLLRGAILNVPSVVDVPILEIELDRSTRRASVTFEARTVLGTVVRSEDYGPLVLR